MQDALSKRVTVNDVLKFRNITGTEVLTRSSNIFHPTKSSFPCFLPCSQFSPRYPDLQAHLLGDIHRPPFIQADLQMAAKQITTIRFKTE